MKNIAIFASGAGSNALKIIEYFKHSSIGSVQLIVSNKSDAQVLAKGEMHEIPTYVVGKKEFREGNGFGDMLQDHNIDIIVLAGFLWLVPSYLVKLYPNKIVNIHPALLPKYGGKGMYGRHVHQAVFENKEKETGITIHYVNEKYDEGNIIFQWKTTLDEADGPGEIAKKVQTLEHLCFPRVIKSLLQK